MKVTRFPENPIIRPDMTPRLGENVNGPSLIQVPDWFECPLGRYDGVSGRGAGLLQILEDLGFLPPAFNSGGAPAFAYLADRGTPDKPFPCTDSLLRLASSVLAAAGVQHGDLLVATEDNGTTVAILATAPSWGTSPHGRKRASPGRWKQLELALV